MLPFITDEIPGIGGTLKRGPEDFEVAEMPAYEPSGNGEHVILEISKRSITTLAAINELAQKLEINAEDIGYAGMKDRHAVTVQRVSVPATADLGKLSDMSFAVKALGLHDSKIKRGHLRGNRFAIRIRGAATDWKQKAADILALLNERGLPNFYGQQRFGRMGTNARDGERAIRQGFLRGPKWKRKLMISAFQSLLFNRWLERRIADGLFAKALKGDVFGRLPEGGVFLSMDPSAEQPRLDVFEISPMGPIFGHKMMKTKDEAAAREEEILASTATDDLPAITPDELKKMKAQGSRRRCRLKPEITLDEIGGDPLFRFELPAGSYATVLLGEFMKTDAALAADADGGEGADPPGTGADGGDE